MDTHAGTVTVWQSGRLAPHVGRHRFELTREQWPGAALLLLSVLVLALYVAVLEGDVDRSEMQHVAQRERALAEAQCETDQPAERRGRCIALLDGDEAPAQVAPGRAPDVQENSAPAATVSLMDAGP